MYIHYHSEYLVKVKLPSHLKCTDVKKICYKHSYVVHLYYINIFCIACNISMQVCACYDSSECRVV